MKEGSGCLLFLICLSQISVVCWITGKCVKVIDSWLFFGFSVCGFSGSTLSNNSSGSAAGECWQIHPELTTNMFILCLIRSWNIHFPVQQPQQTTPRRRSAHTVKLSFKPEEIHSSVRSGNSKICPPFLPCWTVVSWLVLSSLWWWNLVSRRVNGADWKAERGGGWRSLQRIMGKTWATSLVLCKNLRFRLYRINCVPLPR